MSKRSKMIVMAVLAVMVVVTLGVGTVLAAAPQQNNAAACADNCGKGQSCSGSCDASTVQCDGDCTGSCADTCQNQCNGKKSITTEQGNRGVRGATGCGGSCGR